MKRLFVGIEMPDWVGEELADVQRGLPSVRWVPPENLHVTLRFMGSLDPEKICSVDEALDGIVASSFTCALAGVGFFPPRGPARIFWVGVNAEPALQRLHDSVDGLLRRSGVPSDGRKWHPHLTLGRHSPRRPPHESSAASFLQRHDGLSLDAFLVTSFQLYESTLHPDGARYDVLNSYALKG